MVRVVQVILILAAFTSLVWAGLDVRRWCWDHSTSIRSEPDIENGWRWGSEAMRDGYLGLYDRVVAQNPNGKYVLDYMPLRLAVMTLWVRHETSGRPDVTEWDRSYDFNRFVLSFNTACELATSTGLAVLCWIWVRRSSGARLIAAAWTTILPFALSWLNPASLASAHVRPTWDVWLTPFFAWAIVFASLDCWFVAGCCIAVGAMFKGQLLIVSPVFVLWPLMGWRYRAAARWVAGFAIALTALASPWLVPAFDASAREATAMRLLAPPLHAQPILFLLAAAILWPALWGATRRWTPVARCFPARSLKWLIPLTLVAAVWLCVPFYGGSIGWLRVGLIYGGEKFPDLEVGGASSLASILQHSFRWRPRDVAMLVPWLNVAITIEQLLWLIFGALLILCSFAMHRADRRRDRRFLLAMAAPWILYFTVCPRMHERYLLWGATLACAAAAESVGPTLLAIFFMLCSTVMSGYQMLMWGDFRSFLSEYSPTLGMSLRRFVVGTFPGLGWGILLGATVWLYLSLVPSRRTGRSLDDGGLDALHART